ETQKAKEEWWDRECSELEELDARGRSDLMYAKVKKLPAKKNVSSKSTTIKDDTGKLLTDPEEVRRRWKEYIEMLYDKNEKPKPGDLVLGSEGDSCKGPDLLDSEIVSAIGEMKKNKAVGVDNI